MRNGLLLAARPLLHDGLTAIEMDVLEYNKEKINFDLACGFNLSNEFVKKLNALEVETYALPRKKYVPAYIYGIYKLVKEKKYDFVYIHGNSAMLLVEVLPSKLAGTKVVTHCHNTKSNYPFINKLFKPLFNILVDEKIGCSALASEWAYSGKNIITIKNGVDIDTFEFSEFDRCNIRKYLGWEKNKIVGHIGRFIDQKNHERLVDIFECLYAIDSNYRMLLIGEGQLRDSIESKISHKGLSNVVKIINHTDVPEQFMSAMDIMVLPSLFEGLCLVAIEAQANGLPVLIDNFFPKETSATDICERIDLSESDSLWAKKIESMLAKGRKNVRDQLINKDFDKETMMKSIQNVLLK